MIESHIFVEEGAEMGNNLEGNYPGALFVMFDKFVEGVCKLIFGVGGNKELRMVPEDTPYAVFESECLGARDELKHSHDEGID